MRSRITRLPEDVINRIAAGEVVQRPSSALKELLENSIDAGSTSIQILVQDGGLELLQVSDNGCGVSFADLPLLCERYATSKIRTFQDLHNVMSFGFRGEALASISYVARVTVTTKVNRELDSSKEQPHEDALKQPDAVEHTESTRIDRDIDFSKGNLVDPIDSDSLSLPRKIDDNRDGTVGWRCYFVDGKMVGSPEPCAGNPGTTIRIEKMFYNSAVRRKALSRATEEYSRIVDVVSRYALAFPHIGFSCKREDRGTGIRGSASSPLSSSVSAVVFPKTSSTLENIAIYHGNAVASRLRSLDEELEVGPPERFDGGTCLTTGGKTNIQISGYISDISLQLRKQFFCLFVNNRLVESTPIKRAIDACYSAVVCTSGGSGSANSGTKPFTVLLISAPANRVDVNIHPTKSEVCLLDEDSIISRLSEVIRRVLFEGLSRRQMGSLKASVGSSALLDATKKNSTPFSDSSQSALSARGKTLDFSGGSSAVLPPSAVVRIEPQKGALNAFLANHKPQSTEDHSNSNFQIQETHSSTFLAPDDLTSSHASEAKLEATQSPIGATSLSRPNLSTASPTEQPMPQDALKSESDQKTDSTLSLHDKRDEVGEGQTVSKDFANTTLMMMMMPATTTNQPDIEEEEDDIMAHFKKYRTESSLQNDAGGFSEFTGAGIQSKSIKQTTDHDEGVPHFSASSLLGKDANQFDKDLRQDSGGSMSKGSEVVILEHKNNILSSVESIVNQIYESTSAEAQEFIQTLVFVGVLNSHSFLVQSGTLLLAMDTIFFVHMAILQRIFLRWALTSMPAPSICLFTQPISIQDLLLFSLKFDLNAMQPPTDLLADLLRKRRASKKREDPIHPDGGRDIFSKKFQTQPPLNSPMMKASCRGKDNLFPACNESLLLFDVSQGTQEQKPASETVAYVRRLIRRLTRWRSMLEDYFGILISGDGEHLLGLPFGLSSSWPPSMRAVPLFIWFLAERVPYPDSRLGKSLLPKNVNVVVDEGDTLSKTEENSLMHQTIAERACFLSIAEHIASILYCRVPETHSVSSTDKVAGAEQTTVGNPSQLEDSAFNSDKHTRETVSIDGDTIQFGLLPALKNSKLFVPPANILSCGAIRAVVSVESLYKVFERC